MDFITKVSLEESERPAGRFIKGLRCLSVCVEQISKLQ